MRRGARAAVVGLILAAMVGGGMALRLHGIGRSGFWLDEAYSELRTRGSLGETVREAVAYEGSPPLYLVMLHVWRGVVGTSEARFRLLSATLDGLAILAVFGLAREMLNRRAALVAAGMYAVSAFAVTYAREARQYALLYLTAALSSWFFHRIAVSRRPARPQHYIFYIAATAAMLYAFPYALFLAAAQGMFLAALLARGLLQRGKGGGFPIRAAACLVIALATFSPYMPTLAGRAALLNEMQGAYAGGIAGRWQVAADLPVIAKDAVYGAGVFNFRGAWVADLFALLFIASPAALGILKLRGPRQSRFFLAAMLIVPLVCVILIPFRVQVLEAKHVGFLLPLVIVSICSLFSGRLKGRRLAGWCLPFAEGCLVVGIFAGTQAFALREYYADSRGKEAWRGFSPALAGELRDGDAVIFSPSHARVPCEYYLPKDISFGSAGPFDPQGMRKWIVRQSFYVPVLIPLENGLNGGEAVTSEDVEIFLNGIRPPTRAWLVVNRSNVALEDERFFKRLEDLLANRYKEVYPAGLREEYPGTVGTIRPRLFERR